MAKVYKDSALFRWGILLLVSFVLGANYYFFDALSPLQGILENKLGFGPKDYSDILSFYSFPNTFLFMCIIGGIILDKLGIRLTGIIFISFMFIGALLTVYGTSNYYLNGGLGYEFLNSFWSSYSPEKKMLSLGQLLFGLGAETSIVVITKIVVKWFQGYEIALALAINLGIARIGGYLAYIISPRLENIGWTLPIWFAGSLIAFSLLLYIVYVLYDYKLDKQLGEVKLLNKEDEFHLSDVFKVIKNRSFIFITLLCVTFYSAVFPFMKLAVRIFEIKFQIETTLSSSIVSNLYLSTVILTPIFGWFIDKKGKAATLMILGSLVLCLSHLIIGFTSFSPYIPILMLGIAFSLLPAAMWPAVARIIDENKLGTAYGIMFSLQNLGLWGFLKLGGYIAEKVPKIVINGAQYHNYFYTILMFAGIGLIGLFFAIRLKREDKKSVYGLENPSL